MVVEMGVLHKNTVETLGLNLICDLCCDVFVSWKLHHIFFVEFSDLPFFLSVESWLRWWTSSKNVSRLWEASWLDIEALCSDLLTLVYSQHLLTCLARWLLWE